MSSIINQKANESLSEALESLNADDLNGCDETALYNKLRKYFGNHNKGSFTIDVISNSEIEKRAIDIPHSVYRNWRVWDGVVMVLPLSKTAQIAISAEVKVGDTVVGTDKFEHLLAEGYDYFTKSYIEKKGTMAGIKAGIFIEKYILGGLPLETCVFSYADLSANFNGMRFWNHVLQKENDILGNEYNIGPYVSCVDNKWIKSKPIDFRNYMDDSMDESINCSKFSTKYAYNSFVKNIEALGYKCPMDSEKLQAVAKKYGDLSKWVINQNGNGVVKLRSELQN